MTKINKDIKEIEIDGENYILKLMPAMDGLDFIAQMGKEGMNSRMIFNAVSKCVQRGSTGFTEKTFNDHFKGRISHLMRLVDAVVDFNFPDMKEGNEQSDTEDL